MTTRQVIEARKMSRTHVSSLTAVGDISFTFVHQQLSCNHELCVSELSVDGSYSDYLHFNIMIS